MEEESGNGKVSSFSNLRAVEVRQANLRLIEMTPEQLALRIAIASNSGLDFNVAVGALTLAASSIGTLFTLYAQQSDAVGMTVWYVIASSSISIGIYALVRWYRTRGQVGEV